MSVNRNKVKRVLVTIAIVYGLLLIYGCAWQRRLLYFPSKLTDADAKTLAAQENFRAWQNRSGDIIGWKLPASDSPTASVMILHGNAGNALGRGYIAQPIHEAGGMDVFVLEYPGYGARAGSPGKTSWLQAAEEAFALLAKNKPIYLVSESLGTGAAAHLAKSFPTQVAGIAMLVPYDSLPSLAQNKMPLLLPYLFLADRYEPAAWLKSYRGPVKIVIAGRDEIIPPKFGQRLFDSLECWKSLQVIPDAGHDDVAAQSADWWRAVFDFWQH